MGLRQINPVDINLDLWTVLYVRRNGTWVIRRLSGKFHEHPYLFRNLPEGHVIARGRVEPPSRLVVTQSEIGLKELRDLVEPSGAAYGMTVVSAKARRRRS